MTLAPDDLPLSARIHALRDQDVFTGLGLLMEQVLTSHLEADKALSAYLLAVKDRDMPRASLALQRAAHNLQTAHVLTCSAEQRIGREMRREPRVRP